MARYILPWTCALLRRWHLNRQVGQQASRVGASISGFSLQIRRSSAYVVSHPATRNKEVMMKSFSKLLVPLCSGLMMAVIGLDRCSAIDYQPFDWVPLRPGTSVAMGYYEFATYNEYDNTITGTLKKDTHLYSDIGIARYLYFDKHYIFGQPWVLDFILPFGTLNDGKINGHRLGNASGGRGSDCQRRVLAPQSTRTQALALGRRLYHAAAGNL
jgi:hypothetical protein